MSRNILRNNGNVMAQVVFVEENAIRHVVCDVFDEFVTLAHDIWLSYDLAFHHGGGNINNLNRVVPFSPRPRNAIFCTRTFEPDVPQSKWKLSRLVFPGKGERWI